MKFYSSLDFYYAMTILSLLSCIASLFLVEVKDPEDSIQTLNYSKTIE